MLGAVSWFSALWDFFENFVSNFWPTHARRRIIILPPHKLYATEFITRADTDMT